MYSHQFHSVHTICTPLYNHDSHYSHSSTCIHHKSQNVPIVSLQNPLDFPISSLKTSSKPGWWFQPLWKKYEKSLGMILPKTWKNTIDGNQTTNQKALGQLPDVSRRNPLSSGTHGAAGGFHISGTAVQRGSRPLSFGKRWKKSRGSHGKDEQKTGQNQVKTRSKSGQPMEIRSIMILMNKKQVKTRSKPGQNQLKSSFRW